MREAFQPKKCARVTVKGVPVVVKYGDGLVEQVFSGVIGIAAEHGERVLRGLPRILELYFGG